MKTQAILLSVASLFTLMAPFATTPQKAQALLGSDACKNVTFTVNNNVTHQGKAIPITVKKFELQSVEEGRWLNEDFKNQQVPAGAQKYTVREGENIEYGEGNRMTAIRVHFQAKLYGKWINFVATDNDIQFPKCVAGKKYNATVNATL